MEKINTFYCGQTSNDFLVLAFIVIAIIRWTSNFARLLRGPDKVSFSWWQSDKKAAREKKENETMNFVCYPTASRIKSLSLDQRQSA